MNAQCLRALIIALLLGLLFYKHGCEAVENLGFQVTFKNDSNEMLVAQKFPFTIHNVSISTMDTQSDRMNKQYFTVRVHVDPGSIFNMTPVHGLWVRQFKDGTDNLLSGTIESINKFLSDGNVQYNPPAFDYEGDSVVLFYLIDGLLENKNDMDNYHIMHKSMMTIRVRPLYNVDVMILPPTVFIWEDEKTYFADYPINISFMGLPSKFNSLECAVISDKGQMDTPLLRGSGAMMTSRFSNITYTPFRGYNGIDHVRVDCYESQVGLRFGSTFSFVIKAVDNKPLIIAPKQNFSVAEDDIIILGNSLGVYVVDPDAHEYSQSLVIVTLSIVTKPSTFIGFEFSTDDFIAGVNFFSNSSSSTFAMIGYVNHINNALELLMLSLPTNWFGRGEITFSCDQYMLSNTFPTQIPQMPDDASVAHFRFEVISVNDAPQISLKDSKLFIIDEDSIVSLANSAISFFDVDGSKYDRYHLRINVRSYKDMSIGSFHFPLDISAFVKLETVSDPYCTSQGNFVTTLGLNGTIKEISSALDKVHWTPLMHWHGAIQDGVCLSVSDDIGQFSFTTLFLQIKALPDRPQFKVSVSKITLKEDTSLHIGSSVDMTVIDADSEQFPFSLILSYVLTVRTVNGGTLSLSEFVPGSYMMQGGNSDSSLMKIKGDLEVINHALNVMLYTPQKDMDTYDFLKFSIIDDDGFIDSIDLRISLEAVNDAPRINISSPIYLYQENGMVSLHFNKFELSDIDGMLSDDVELLVSCLSDYTEKIEVNVESHKGVTVSNKSYTQLIISGPIDSVVEVVMSSKLQVLFSSAATHLKYWMLKLQIRDKLGAFTEKELWLLLPERWNIVPAIIQPGHNLVTQEDIPIKIGSHLSLQGLKNSDTLYEVSLVTRTIVIPNILTISIEIDSSRTCVDEVQYELIISNRSTISFHVNATDDELKDRIEEFPMITQVKVTSHPDNNDNIYSRTIRLLSFEEVSFDLVFIPTAATIQSICNPRRSIQSIPVSSLQNELLENWGLPSILEDGGLSFSDHGFGGIFFVEYSCNDPCPIITMRGELSNLNNALADLLYVPPSNFFGRARIDVKVSTVFNTYGISLGSDSVEATLLIDIESHDDPPSILWNRAQFTDYAIIIEASINEVVFFGKNLTLLDIDSSSDDILSVVNVSAGQICQEMQKEDYPHDDAYSQTKYCGEKSTRQLMRSGNLSSINDWLITLTYVPDIMWTGVDEIEIRVIENSFELKSVIPVHVSGILPYPFIVILEPYRIIEGFEDTTLKLEGLSLRHNPQLVDMMVSLKQEDYIIEADISVSSGTIQFGIENDCVIHRLNQSSLRIKGYVEMMNESLKTLIFIPNDDYVGSVTLNIDLLDGPRNYHELDMSLQINSVNDPPAIIFPPIHYGYVFKVYEETISTLWSSYSDDSFGRCSDNCWETDKTSICCPLRIEDKDSKDDDIIRVEIRTENGAVRLPRYYFHEDYPNHTTTIESRFKQFLEVYGTLREINEALNGALFIGNRDFNSRDRKLAQLHITVTDEANMSSDITLYFQVIPVNDRPKIITDMSCKQNETKGIVLDGINSDAPIICYGLHTHEDTRLRLPSFSVSDVDFSSFNDMMQLRLSAQHGKLSIENGFNIFKWIEGTSKRPSNLYIMRGSIHGINDVLRGISYMPHLNYHGCDEIEVVISDMGNFGVDVMTRSNDVNLSTSIVFPITVAHVKDIPTIHVPSEIRTVEGTKIKVDASIFHGDSNEEEVEVHIRCIHGHVSMISTQGIALELSNHSNVHALYGKGTVAAWNDVLYDLYYIPKLYWNSFNNYWDQIRWTVFNVDDGREEVDTWQETLVQVEPVNDAPEWNVPGMHMILQGTGGYKIDYIDPIILDEDETFLLQSISIHDPDVLEDGEFNRIQDFLIQVEIFASFGVLTLLKREGLIFQQGKDGSTYMNFRGNIAHCNSAIYEIKYKPFKNFHGEDAIHLHVRDEGNIGFGGEKMSNITIPIVVKSVIDVPSIVSADILYCVQAKPCSISNVSIIDPDENIQLWIEITATNGVISFLKTFTSLLMMNDSSLSNNKLDNDSSLAQWTGNASSLNELLKNLLYTPEKGNQYSGRLEHLHFVVWSLPVDGDDSMPSTSTHDLKIIVTTK